MSKFTQSKLLLPNKDLGVISLHITEIFKITINYFRFHEAEMLKALTKYGWSGYPIHSGIY